MPAKPTWFLELPRILEEVRTLPCPVLDRSAFERLFGVRRRQAIQLMHRFGGYQTGKTFLIDRLRLVAELERASAGPDYSFEVRRKERLVDSLAKFDRHRAADRVKIPVLALPPSDFPFPADVHLTAGRLTIDFDTPENLLSKLFLLAQKMAEDFDGMWMSVQQKSQG